MRGICKFCGQVQETEQAIQVDADLEATEECSCWQAARRRKRQKSVDTAMENASALFGEESSEESGFDPVDEVTWALIATAIHAIADGQCAKVQFAMERGGKGCIKANSKNEIEVERAETRSRKL